MGDHDPAKAMSFVDALAAMRKGHSVRRAEWHRLAKIRLENGVFRYTTPFVDWKETVYAVEGFEALANDWMII